MRRPWMLTALLPLLALALRGGAAPLEPAPEGSFTIVVIPDTQDYHGEGTGRPKDSTDPVTNPVFANHVRWITDHLVDQRIVFVSHVGDIVDRNKPEQWAVAREMMDQLHGRVPYGISLGNHDFQGSTGNSTLFQRTFGAERFRDFDWYGGSFEPASDAEKWYGNNANSYQLFEAGGEKFVFLHLECNAPDPIVAWADSILTRYADRRALLTTHMDTGPAAKPVEPEDFYKLPKGRMTWTKCHGAAGNSGVQLWDKLYRKHANLAFIFSGDQRRTTAFRLESIADDGHSIWSMCSDYTSSGPLRLYRFLPNEQRVQVITWDTTLDEVVTSTKFVPEADQHAFDLPWPPRQQAAAPAAE